MNEREVVELARNLGYKVKLADDAAPCECDCGCRQLTCIVVEEEFVGWPYKHEPRQNVRVCKDCLLRWVFGD